MKITIDYLDVIYVFDNIKNMQLYLLYMYLFICMCVCIYVMYEGENERVQSVIKSSPIYSLFFSTLANIKFCYIS